MSPTHSSRSAALDAILKKYTSLDQPNGTVKGAAFIVHSEADGFAYSGSSGIADFTVGNVFTLDTGCEIASLTKLATATAVMQLVERSAITLDQDLGEVIPELSNRDVLRGFEKNGNAKFEKQRKSITMTHLLTHTSGFGYDGLDPDLIKWRTSINSTINSSSLSRVALDIPLKFQPGEGWTYGIGLDWAGVVIERLTGLPLEEYMQQRIFAPLGMTLTTFRPEQHPKLHKNRAQMSLRERPRGRLSATVPMKSAYTDLDCGGDGLVSTASDYGKLLKALLNDGEDILSKEHVPELYIPRIEDTTALESSLFGPMQNVFAPGYPAKIPVNYGLGGALNMSGIPGKRSKGSMMWTGATNTHWWLDPQSRLSATLFVQVWPPGDAVVIDLYDELERAVYGH